MEDAKSINILIDKAIKKDELAFTTLIHTIDKEMYKIAKIKLKSDDDVFDAIQNTIILIYKNLKKLRKKEFFKTWSMRILLNECNKILKHKQIYYNKNIEYDENIDKIANTTKKLEKIEAKYDLKSLLNCLNESEKITMTLYYGENFNISEISNILSEPEGTIKSRINRAKIKIKNYIEEEKIYE